VAFGGILILIGAMITPSLCKFEKHKTADGDTQAGSGEGGDKEP